MSRAKRGWRHCTWLSDSSGDSAIVEYIEGKQVIHHGRRYQVMTNSPIFDKQLALNEYWQQIGGAIMLPGTNRALDRFARASFYVNAIPQKREPDLAIASVFSVIRNASVPFGLNTPDEPNISSTRWRTVFDHKRKLYFLVGTYAQRLLGRSQGHRLRPRRSRNPQARSRLEPDAHLFRRHDQGVQAVQALRVPRLAVRVTDGLPRRAEAPCPASPGAARRSS